jgi:phage shock protein A
VFNKFERMRERVEQAEAEAEALAELRGADLSRATADVDAPASATDDIEAELQALKAKRTGG